MVHIAIVDDDPFFRNTLSSYVDRFLADQGREYSLSLFCDGKEILDSLKKFDLVFMDIEMKGVDGIAAAQELRARGDRFVLLFVTNLANLAIKGYEVEAMDFLVKPVEYDEFAFKLEKALRRTGLLSNRLVRFSTSEGIVVVPVQDITYVEVNVHTIIVHTVKEDIKLYGSLRKVAADINDVDFVYINKFYLVNLRHLEKVEGNMAIVRGNPLLISRSRKKVVRERLLRYIGKNRI